jgi:bifunctional enzyme CysN/CysC
VTAVEAQRKSQIRVVAVGHVDHGKSTLIGRLMHDTGNLSSGKLEELRAASDRRGVPFEWSFVLDALQSERDQAITIDTTRIWLRTLERDIVLIDAPGHKEFLRNMVTGASDADAALLVVDAFEGVSEQTCRHALLFELIGVRQVVVAINKMDRVGYASERYANVRSELAVLLERIGIVPRAFVPLCAREGENLYARSQSMPWYEGPTVFAALLDLEPFRRDATSSLRLAVQGIVRRELERIVVGRIESGTLGVGEEILISPAQRTARIRSIETWPPREKVEARAGESVGFTLDGAHFVDRGDIVSDSLNPPVLATSFRARLLWLGQRALRVGDHFKLRVGTRQATVAVRAIERVVDIETLAGVEADSARTNDVAEVIFSSPEVLALDDVVRHPGLARFILLDGLSIVAGGTVLDVLGPLGDGANLVPVDHLLDREARARRNGHRGAVIWLTGLPAAGKSTIAMELERRLFEKGYHAYVLDGDNVRGKLCRDLGFSATDRAENVRRVGEVAALFADSGMIAIAAFISPHRAERDEARSAAGGAFHEIYIDAEAAVCEARDPKGHYAKARAGELPDFTGITGDYEPPLNPELVVDTGTSPLQDCVEKVLAYIEERITAPDALQPLGAIGAKH